MTTTMAPEQAQQPKKDPMRFHLHYQRAKAKGGGSPYAGGSSFMERVSEAVASGMGTVAFLVVSSAVILSWVLANHVITFLRASWTGLLDGKVFDPAPFILLNLVFSAVAFYTGALVIIAQKAQTRTDQANEEAAAKHREELAQFQTELLQKNTPPSYNPNMHKNTPARPDQPHPRPEKLTPLPEQAKASPGARTPATS